MVAKILANFIHYYEARGKDEIKSFLTTLTATFITAFGYFAVTGGFSDVIFGAEPVEWVLFGKAVLDAFVRSVVAGLFFAVLGGKAFPIRSSSGKV